MGRAQLGRGEGARTARYGMGREQMRCNTIRYDGVVEVRWRFRICGTGKQGVSAVVQRSGTAGLDYKGTTRKLQSPVVINPSTGRREGWCAGALLPPGGALVRLGLNFRSMACSEPGDDKRVGPVTLTGTKRDEKRGGTRADNNLTVSKRWGRDGRQNRKPRPLLKRARVMPRVHVQVLARPRPGCCCCDAWVPSDIINFSQLNCPLETSFTMETFICQPSFNLLSSA